MNPHNLTASEVREKLAELGGTLEEVVAALKAQGCQGHPKDSGCCPIAVFLGWGDYHIEVDANAVTWDAPGEDAFDLPPHLSDFILRFDRLEFPALIHPTWSPNRGGM